MLLKIQADILKFIVNCSFATSSSPGSLSLKDLLALRLTCKPMGDFLEQNVEKVRAKGQAIIPGIKLLFPFLETITGEVSILSEVFLAFKDVAFKDITFSILRKGFDKEFQKECRKNRSVWKRDRPHTTLLRFDRFMHKFMCGCLLVGFPSSSDKRILRLERSPKHVNDTRAFDRFVAIENKRLSIQLYFLIELLDYEDDKDSKSKDVFEVLGRYTESVSFPTLDDNREYIFPGYKEEGLNRSIMAINELLENTPEINELYISKDFDILDCNTISHYFPLMKRFQDDKIICHYPRQKEIILEGKRSLML